MLMEMPINELRECITYNPITGVFRRAKNSGWRNRFKAGEVAGWIDAKGYRGIKINGKSFKAHRIAYALMTGEWPKADIDHANGIKSDNRWENIRSATRAENQWNTATRKDNKSGYRGVLQHGKRWRAAITVNKKRISIGVFDTAEQAAAAYAKVQNDHHREFAKMGEVAIASLQRTNLLSSGLNVEWQSWPFDKPRPKLWAAGRVEATADFFDQISSWYPDFAVRVCEDRPDLLVSEERCTEFDPL